MRSWRPYYTVLIGPLLNFYKDRKEFQAYLSASPPINVSHGTCEVAKDYQKKRNTLRLKYVASGIVCVCGDQSILYIPLTTSKERSR